MKSDVLEFMDRYQRHTVKMLREQAIAKRMKALNVYVLEVEPPDTRVYPSCLDFALLPEVRALIDAPSDINVSRSDFKRLKPFMDRYAAKWIKKLKKDLGAKIRDRLDGIDPKTDPLELAVGFYWRCNGEDEDCNSWLVDYPRMLAHRCLLPEGHEEDEKEELADRDETVRDYKKIIQGANSWTSCGGKFHRNSMIPLVKAASIVVEKLGLDPRTATVTQINNLPRRLRLYSTRDIFGNIATFSRSKFGLAEIFGWTAAVRP